MGQLFKNQSSIVITIDTGIDLAGASGVKILFNKPNGAKGEWIGTVSGTTISYPLTETDIDRDGTWRFQALFIKSGKKYFSDITERHFLKPLNS